MTQYKDRFYLPEFKILDNGEYASVCSEKDSPSACARYAQNIKTKKENYYIKLHGGHVVNPYSGGYTAKMDRNLIKYKKVSAELFKKYVTYLKTGANYLIREVERTLSDG